MAFPDEEKQNAGVEMAFPDEEKQNVRVEITFPNDNSASPPLRRCFFKANAGNAATALVFES